MILFYSPGRIEGTHPVPGFGGERAWAVDVTATGNNAPPLAAATPSRERRAELPAKCGACAIRDLAVCAVLDDLELTRLASIAVTVKFADNQVILLEGDPAEALFNVSDGAVNLYKLLPDGRRMITGFLFPGDFLGLAHNDTYAYSAEANGKVRMCRFPRRRFEALLEEFPHLERRLLTDASNELAQAQDQMLLLGRKTAKEKIATFLIQLADRQRQRGEPENIVQLPMSRAEIADYLGLTTETVSRTITKLKSTGAIRLQKAQTIQLSNGAELTEIAEGT